MYGHAEQSLAPNSVQDRLDESPYEANDASRLAKQHLENTRANGYMTNQYAGGGTHKTKAKVKGHSEHARDEDELGDDYNV